MLLSCLMLFCNGLEASLRKLLVVSHISIFKSEFLLCSLQMQYPPVFEKLSTFYALVERMFSITGKNFPSGSFFGHSDPALCFISRCCWSRNKKSELFANIFLCMKLCLCVD